MLGNNHVIILATVISLLSYITDSEKHIYQSGEESIVKPSQWAAETDSLPVACIESVPTRIVRNVPVKFFACQKGYDSLLWEVKGRTNGQIISHASFTNDTVVYTFSEQGLYWMNLTTYYNGLSKHENVGFWVGHPYSENCEDYLEFSPLFSSDFSDVDSWSLHAEQVANPLPGRNPRASASIANDTLVLSSNQDLHCPAAYAKASLPRTIGFTDVRISLFGLTHFHWPHVAFDLDLKLGEKKISIRHPRIFNNHYDHEVHGTKINELSILVTNECTMIAIDGAEYQELSSEIFIDPDGSSENYIQVGVSPCGADDGHSANLKLNAIRIDTVSRYLNRPPRVMMADRLVLHEGFGATTINLDGVYVDPEGGKLSYTVLSQTGALALQLVQNQVQIQETAVGESSLVLQIADEHQATITDTLTFFVNQLPSRLVAIDTALQVGFEVWELDIGANYTDPEQHSLSYEVTGHSENINYTFTDHQLKVLESGFGEAWVSLSVMDQLGAKLLDSIKLFINRPPLSLMAGDILLQKGFDSLIVHLDSLYVDPDGRPMTYSLLDSDSLLSTNIIDGSNQLMIKEIGYGKSKVAFEVKDLHGAKINDTISFHINQPPVFLQPLDSLLFIEGFVDHVVCLNEFIIDPDNHTVTYSRVDSLDFLHITVEDSLLRIEESEPGSGILHLEAHDPYQGVLMIDIFMEVLRPLSVKPSLNFSIYPNPARSHFFIKSSHPISDMQLSDLSGKIYPLPSNNNSINVSQLPRGIYMLHIRVNGGDFNLKLILRD